MVFSTVDGSSPDQVAKFSSNYVMTMPFVLQKEAIVGVMCTWCALIITVVPSMIQFTQGDPNLSADWRLKENGDGTVQFESVICQGACVGINKGGTLVKNISIFLVVSPHQLL